MIRRIVFFSLALVFASAPGFAQSSGYPAAQPGTAAVTAATAVPAVPKDPKDLMLLAAKVNGLGSIVAQPWHVKANFQTFDADGKPKDKGTFEEWWAGPKKYKVSYLSNGFSQTEYVNGDQDVTTGDAGQAPFPEEIIGEYLINPISLKNKLNKKDRFSIHKRKLAGVSLNCVEPESPPKFDVSVHFCFEPNPVIRLEYAPDGMFVAFNNVIRAGDHYFAKEIITGNASLTIAKADVARLEIPAAFGDSEFVAPASAVPIPSRPLRIEIGSKLKRISGEDPRYPQEAKRSRIQGTVVLEAMIAKNGTIDSLSVVSGPKELRKSAEDAVKTWKYEPYLWNGQPEEIDMTINVVYTLGRIDVLKSPP